MKNGVTAIVMVGLAVWLGAAGGNLARAQEALGLGNSRDEMTFQGTGTQVINVVWQNCNRDGCRLGGSASTMDQFRSVGTYRFTSTTPRPFKLMGSAAVGLFHVEQSSAILFSYASPHGTLEGMAHFTSLVQNKGSLMASLAGTLQVVGGSYAGQFTGPGNLNLAVAVGKQNLSNLLDSTAAAHGEIDFLSSLTPASLCRSASVVASTLKGAPLPGGDIWFSATLRARGVHAGTYLQFQGGYIQFAANGNTYILHVPNALITFSPSVRCASTSYHALTDTWETTVPWNESGEIFLSALAFPVPASGFSGSIGAAKWSESFASNTPGVTVQWQWSAAVFRRFSAGYNSLGVKATQQSACPYPNDDHAGTPEEFAGAAIGGARRGAAQTAGAWSESVTDQANCP